MSKFGLDPDGIEQFHRSFVKALRLGEEMLEQMNKWMIKEGPKAEVIDQGKRISIFIEAPGLSKSQLSKWSYRTSGRHFYLRGLIDIEQSVRDRMGRYYSERRQERFTRYIPLPAPVHNRMRFFDCENGLVCLKFDKHTQGGDGVWQDFRS